MILPYLRYNIRRVSYNLFQLWDHLDRMTLVWTNERHQNETPWCGVPNSKTLLAEASLLCRIWSRDVQCPTLRWQNEAVHMHASP